jgi:cytoskeletal protein CcmA (bactofilin family)
MNNNISSVKSLKTNGVVNLSNSLYVNKNKIGINNLNPTYTLDIIGDINYTGNFYHNGIKTSMQNNYSLNNNLNDNLNISVNSIWEKDYNNNSIYYNNYVGIGITKPNYMLDVNGATNINGNLYINNSINSSNTIYCTNIVASNSITGNTLIINKDSNIKGNLIVSGNIDCNYINVQNNYVFNSDIVFNGNITVNGYADILGNFSINTNKFTVNSTTGDVYIDKSLSINSSIYITNSLLANGIATFNNSVYVNNLFINGNISGYNDLDITSNLTANNITANSTISVDGGYIYNQQGAAFFVLYSDNDSALYVGGGSTITGNLNVSGSVNANTSEFNIYSANIINNFSCYADAQISGNLLVQSNITCYSNINSYTINTGYIGNTFLYVPTCNIDSNGNISADGSLYIKKLSNFDDDVTINGNLTVSGITVLESYCTFQSITTSGNLTGSQIFIDNYNFYNDNTNQFVNINYSTPSISTTTGALTVNGGVGINGDLNVGGNIIGNINMRNLTTISSGLIFNSINIVPDKLDSISKEITLFDNTNSSENIINLNNSDKIAAYNITDINSNIIYIIDSDTIGDHIDITININSKKIGTCFKFLINCNVNSQINFLLNKNLFGMIINNGKYLSCSNTNKIYLNNINVGDYIEFYGVKNYFYVKAISSNDFGFVL